MDVTKLFEIGQVPFKIVEFTKFSMKQESKSKKVDKLFDVRLGHFWSIRIHACYSSWLIQLFI